ncbi:hypothetical protein QBC34DRAFT_383510 [Podospora aff. communis PSN243]|uniref:Uncharacterized protein n=1 Tax=Podospora aff. communis PSN243 TaxID=3040156 RepID=A0AAV9GGK1_9PEZI|nr:hypothetical protein QBC34DRAFT_383510 [Podospora aff. communis PSN243]
MAENATNDQEALGVGPLLSDRYTRLQIEISGKRAELRQQVDQHDKECDATAAQLQNNQREPQEAMNHNRSIIERLMHENVDLLKNLDRGKSELRELEDRRRFFKAEAKSMLQTYIRSRALREIAEASRTTEVDAPNHVSHATSGRGANSGPSITVNRVAKQIDQSPPNSLKADRTSGKRCRTPDNDEDDEYKLDDDGDSDAENEDISTESVAMDIFLDGEATLPAIEFQEVSRMGLWIVKYPGGTPDIGKLYVLECDQCGDVERPKLHWTGAGALGAATSHARAQNHLGASIVKRSDAIKLFGRLVLNCTKKDAVEHNRQLETYEKDKKGYGSMQHPAVGEVCTWLHPSGSRWAVVCLPTAGRLDKYGPNGLFEDSFKPADTPDCYKRTPDKSLVVTNGSLEWAEGFQDAERQQKPHGMGTRQGTGPF